MDELEEVKGYLHQYIDDSPSNDPEEDKHILEELLWWLESLERKTHAPGKSQ